MKVNVQQVLKNIEGEPMKTQKVVGGKVEVVDLTLASVAIDALQSSFEDEKHLSGTDKVARFNLALKIFQNPEVELSSAEIVQIKDLVSKAYGPLIVGRVYEILN